MCHGQVKGSKTIRFKPADGRHANAVPYKRDKRKWEDEE
jgi:hypothetical protein